MMEIQAAFFFWWVQTSNHKKIDQNASTYRYRNIYLNEAGLRIQQLSNCGASRLWHCPLHQSCRVVSNTFLNSFNFRPGPSLFCIICNGTVWSCISMISASAVTCTSMGSYTIAIRWSVSHRGREVRLRLSQTYSESETARRLRADSKPEWLSVT